MLTRLGCGIHHTATHLVATGEKVKRFGTEATSEHIRGAAPLSVLRANRHRLDFAGNRAANRALHIIIVVQLRYCLRTHAYLERRLADGKTEKEDVRCLKRLVGRELCSNHQADLAKLPQAT